MFHWNKAIYMDDAVRKKPLKYRKILERKKIIKQCYCITAPANEDNLMDIYSTRELWFQYYRRKNMEIIGIAKTMETAYELVEKMVVDIIEKYGEANSETLKKYFDIKSNEEK